MTFASCRWISVRYNKPGRGPGDGCLLGRAQDAVCHQSQDLWLLTLMKIKYKIQPLNHTSHILSSTTACGAEHVHENILLDRTDLQGPGRRKI